MIEGHVRVLRRDETKVPPLVRKIEALMEDAHRLLDEAEGLVIEAKQAGEPVVEAVEVLLGFDHEFEQVNRMDFLNG